MPVRDEGPRVAATMEAILASSRLPDEIIVADGLSTDDTVERFKAYERRGVDIRVVSNPAVFSGGGRNAGTAHSKGEVVLFADCGNPVAADWISEMVRPFEEVDDVDIVCGVFEPLVATDFEHCVAAIHYPQNYRLNEYSQPERNALVPRVLLPGGGTIAMKRTTFDAVGGYPEWLHRAQDKVFSRKAYAMGMRVVVSWNARIAHHMRGDFRSVFRLTFDYARGNARSRFLDRHVVKLMGFYGGLLGLVAAAQLFPWLYGCALLAFCAYSFHAAYRKLIRKDGRIKKLCYLWVAPLILWTRDLGAISGQWVGWLEWLLVPRFRRSFGAYTSTCDRTRLPFLEP